MIVLPKMETNHGSEVTKLLQAGLPEGHNHSLFKGLLFFCAGSIIHGVHTPEIDQLGGLAKRMPRTAMCFLIGALAVCGLPALNGFVSEFLIYLGLFDTLTTGGGEMFAGAALAAPVLALTGALAVTCFVKAFGVVFLGTARSDSARQAREPGGFMLAPMILMAACCFCIGLAPTWFIPILSKAVSAWAPELDDVRGQITALAPLDWISTVAIILVTAIAVISLLLWLRLRGSVVETGPTWGCGYGAPTPRMQYTSSSFVEMLVGLFGWVLRARTQHSKLTAFFPESSEFHREIDDPVLDEAMLPAFSFFATQFAWFRIFQQGKIQVYMLYIFGALLILLLWR